MDAGPKFYVVGSPTLYMTLRSRSQPFFCIAIFYNFSFFAKPSMDFIHLWHDDIALSKILHSIITIPVHGIKVKVTDFKFFMFGMNRFKILKCFIKEKRNCRRAFLSGDRSYFALWYKWKFSTFYTLAVMISFVKLTCSLLLKMLPKYTTD